MKRTILSLMMFGLFASAQTAAVAQNVTADDKSGESAQTGNTQGSDATAPKTTNGAKRKPGAKDDVGVRPASKSDLESVRAQAQTRYDAAKAKCEAMSGNAMRTCMTDAKTARAAELSKAQRPTEGRDDTQQPGNQAPRKSVKSGAATSNGATTTQDSNGRGGVDDTTAGNSGTSGTRPTEGRDDSQQPANQAPRKNVKSGSAPTSGAATTQDSGDRGGVDGAAAGNADMSGARSTDGRDDSQQPGNQAPRKSVKSGSAPTSGAATTQDSSDRGGVEGAAASNSDTSGSRSTEARDDAQQPANQAPRKNVKSGTTPSTGAATPSESGDRGGQPATAAGNSDPSGPRSTAGYNAAQEMAQSRYEYAASKCNSLSGEAGRACMADAAKARTEALNAAKTQWESGMQSDDSSQNRPVSDRNGSDGVTPTAYEVPSDMATSGTSR